MAVEGRLEQPREHVCDGTVVASACSYRGPDGLVCPDAAEPSGLCVWHDPGVLKSGPDWQHRLEALARSGRSLAGFSLQGAHLDGIDLTLSGRPLGVDLRGADLTRASLRGAHLYRADLQGADLLKADLRGANLNEADLEDTDLLATILAGARAEGTRWNLPIRQERQAYMARARGDSPAALQLFKEGEEIYRDLRVIADAHGHHRTAGDFFFREMRMRHHRLPPYGWEWLVSTFAFLLYGYGEKPFYIIANALAYLAGVAALYFLIGLSENGHVVAFDAHASWADNLVSYAKCLYFSIITYTTVGYGDFVPLDAAKPIAALEALSGNFMMAMFVVVFMRKLGR
jgi:hypothetical protein